MAIKTESRADMNHVPEPTPNETPRVQVSIAAVQRLIALMNSSDLSEIIVERPSVGLRLALRHTVAPATMVPSGVGGALPAPTIAPPPAPAKEAPELITITAPLVGTFFPMLKAGQKPLVAVGDIVREGQHVAGIESLHVMNEVQSPVIGRVKRILAQRGQPVEYGQTLMELEPLHEPGA